MKPSFSLLFVHGDGSRVKRLRVPRPIAYGTLGLVGSAVCVSGAYLLLQGLLLAALRDRVEAQRAVIDAFQTRVATVRSEITAWRALHAKMRDAIGPEADSNATSGVGGAAPVAVVPAPSVRLPAWKELDLLAASVAEEGPRLRELEQATSRTGELVKALPLRWPVRGPVNSEYGLRQSPLTRRPEEHEGIDIGTSPGTPVRSPAAGTVITASSGGDFGRHVTLDHGNGVRSRYGHLKELDVKVGQRVEKGEVIGLVGSSGRSTGPHLHYEVQVDGKPVDPRPFLPGRSAGTP